MNRLQFLKAAAGLALVPVAGLAVAAAKGTPAEAEAMVRKAAALIKSAGPAKAFEEITNGAAFKDRDLYVFVYDLTGKCVAHGANPKLIGKDLIGLKDPDGKPLVQMLVDLAKDKGKGWTDTVKFRNPTTDQIQTRVNYIERVGDYAVGSGVFKD
jgi:signal transduction histidine kinase